MTTREIVLITLAYGVALAAAIYFTRATMRRVVGAVAGGGVAGSFGLGAMVLGQETGVWWISLPVTNEEPPQRHGYLSRSWLSA